MIEVAKPLPPLEPNDNVLERQDKVYAPENLSHPATVPRSSIVTSLNWQ